MQIRHYLPIFGLFSLALLLGACGDTWSGLKEDTGENLEAAGETVEEAGEDVEGAAQ